MIICYRALVQAADDAPIVALQEGLRARGFVPLAFFVSSLKDAVSSARLEAVLSVLRPSLVMNLTSFSCKRRLAFDGIVFQGILASCDYEQWWQSKRGLGPRDVAMNIALPEMDGFIITRPLSFKAAACFDSVVQASLVKHRPVADRIDFVCDMMMRWQQLRTVARHKQKLALVMAQYPNKDGRLGNGVGLDTPASVVTILHDLQRRGYDLGDNPLPQDSDALMARLMTVPTNDKAFMARRLPEVFLSEEAYRRIWRGLPSVLRRRIEQRWGPSENDPFFDKRRRRFALSVMRFGKVVLVIQPSRGYHIDAAAHYHDADLPPPHFYVAVYGWLRDVERVLAVVHVGKHGNLEWLPGKGVGLGQHCFPEAIFGAMPHFYPFIVNDPGEGAQAKRRAQAVILDHLTPPMARGGLYGFLAEFEALSDEYAEASLLAPTRAQTLRHELWRLAQQHGLDKDCGIEDHDSEDVALNKLDTHLCTIKESQIRDGLHVYGGVFPEAQKAEMLVSLLRFPRERGEGKDESLLRALSADLGLGDCDPLSCDVSAIWRGGKVWGRRCLRYKDVIAVLEDLALAVIDGSVDVPRSWRRVRQVLSSAEALEQLLRDNGVAEREGLARGLRGAFVEAGPSGAPTKGRLDIFPLGRNFYSMDVRLMPTPSAYRLGRESAETFVEDYCQRHGVMPRRVALSVWGTANMRSGGDDIGQAFALMGVEPCWDAGSRRVHGIKVLPLEVLGRPRVDVVLRVSGLFRDAFGHVMDMFSAAVDAVCAQDESARDNPLRAGVLQDKRSWQRQGVLPDDAERFARLRLFGSKPGAYGAGMQALIDEGGWKNDKDLADAFVAWGGFGYGGQDWHGQSVPDVMRQCLTQVQAVLHNQDNSEHDILDSDDYYQFQGGMTATVRHLSGRQPSVYHQHHANPYRLRVGLLRQEIGRVVRARATNPKWIRGVMRHGYKGAFELAATVDYLFAFAATTREVEDHHFDALFSAYLLDKKVQGFMRQHNRHALREMATRFSEAIERGLWHPRRNDAANLLESVSQEDNDERRPECKSQS